MIHNSWEPWMRKLEKFMHKKKVFPLLFHIGSQSDGVRWKKFISSLRTYSFYASVPAREWRLGKVCERQIKTRDSPILSAAECSILRIRKKMRAKASRVLESSLPVALSPERSHEPRKLEIRKKSVHSAKNSHHHLDDLWKWKEEVEEKIFSVLFYRHPTIDFSRFEWTLKKDPKKCKFFFRCTSVRCSPTLTAFFSCVGFCSLIPKVETWTSRRRKIKEKSFRNLIDKIR